MKKRIRIPFCSTINLFIETLTGTCFELRVSPFETILSVKAKIQRLEGIPISQQHLIWEGTELDDEFCLHDYRITSDSTVRLVIALRGGPINTRRIAVDEPSFMEMADYIDANQEELLEELSLPQNSGKTDGDSQVTLLVYRNGDQINFFRVIDRGDGSLTPISEPYRTKSYSDIGTEHDDVMSRTKFTMSRITENRITATKMKRLQNQMQILKLKDSSLHKVRPPGASPSENQIDGPKQDSQKSRDFAAVHRRKMSAGRITPKTEPRVKLPSDDPLSAPLRTPRKPDVPSSGKMRFARELRPKVSSNHHDVYLRSYGLLPLQKRLNGDEDDQNQSRPDLSCDNATAGCACKGDGQAKHPQKSDFATVDRAPSCHVWCRHALGQPCTTRQKPPPDLGTFSQTEPVKYTETPQQHQSIIGAPGLLRAEDSQLPPIIANSSLGKKSLNSRISTRSGHAMAKKPSLHQFEERNLIPPDYHSLYDISKELRDSDHPAPSSSRFSGNPEHMKLGTKYFNHCDEILQSKLDGECGNSVNKLRTPCTSGTNNKNCMVDLDSVSNVSCYTRTAAHCSSTLLPPVRPLVLKKRRCVCCGKKTGLATSYTCRCGKNFCATHRYAETHDCTFDYKSSGRQLLKESNPIISAPKLPKI